MQPDVHDNISLKLNPFDENPDHLNEDIFKIHMMMVHICKGLMIQLIINSLSDIISDEILITHLKNEHFDLAITELYNFCPFGLFDLLNIRTYIVASAIGVHEQIEILLGVYPPSSSIPS